MPKMHIGGILGYKICPLMFEVIRETNGQNTLQPF
jgi:hypothetical protein